MGRGAPALGPGVVASPAVPLRDRGRRARRSVRPGGPPGVRGGDLRLDPRPARGCHGMTERSSLHDEVIEVARDLIRLDTTNAREPGRGNETLCAEYLADYLGRFGIEAELVARQADRANVVARIPGSDPAAESLAFVGHTDVVPCD